jgi:hypothetical protein
MTDIAIRDDSNGEVTESDVQPRPQPIDMSGSALLLWAQEARQAAQIATSLAQTSFVPASLRGKPADITAAILAGQELGLRPMASLRSLDVIQGTPGLRAHAMRGLVQSHGHETELVESTDERCVMRGRRKGAVDWQTVEWDMQRAARLGLTGKEQWKKQPRTMLIARATGEICRLIASDVLHAVPYAAEELDGYGADVEGGQPVQVAPQVTAAEILGGRPADRVTAAEVTGARSVSGPPVNGNGSQSAFDGDDWPAPAQPGGGS